MKEVLKISKTIELRKIIKSILSETNRDVFFERADKNSIYPYIVYSIESINFNFGEREDVILSVNIWDKNESSSRIEVLTDEIEKKFMFNNKPTEKILPTFYLESRNVIPDEDELIKRRELRILIQNYYIGG